MDVQKAAHLALCLVTLELRHCLDDVTRRQPAEACVVFIFSEISEQEEERMDAD